MADSLWWCLRMVYGLGSFCHQERFCQKISIRVSPISARSAPSCHISSSTRGFLYIYARDPRRPLGQIDSRFEDIESAWRILAPVLSLHYGAPGSTRLDLWCHCTPPLSTKGKIDCLLSTTRRIPRSFSQRFDQAITNKIQGFNNDLRHARLDEHPRREPMGGLEFLVLSQIAWDVNLRYCQVKWIWPKIGQSTNS